MVANIGLMIGCYVMLYCIQLLHDEKTEGITALCTILCLILTLIATIDTIYLHTVAKSRSTTSVLEENILLEEEER